MGINIQAYAPDPNARFRGKKKEPAGYNKKESRLLIIRNVDGGNEIREGAIAWLDGSEILVAFICLENIRSTSGG